MFLFYVLFGLFMTSFNEVDSQSACEVSGSFFESAVYAVRRYYLRKEMTSNFNLLVAEATCISLGGRLAEINDEAELRFVQCFVNPYQLTTVYITGSDEIQEGRWINPFTKTPLSTVKFGNQEPNGGTAEGCLCLWKMVGYLMCDVPCTGIPNGTSFLCEVPVLI